MKTLRVRRSAMPSRWALIVLAVCVAASMFINYRASAQSTADKPAPTTPAPAKAEPTTKPAEPAATKGRAPASKAEDSATIEDDPTLVPDDKESADNNVTFPTDI